MAANSYHFVAHKAAEMVSKGHLGNSVVAGTAGVIAAIGAPVIAPATAAVIASCAVGLGVYAGICKLGEWVNK